MPQIRPATPNDLVTVLSWVPTAEALRLWGGPLLSFPPSVSQTWRDIAATDGNSFTFVDENGRLMGFGQALQRDAQTIHLARIILAPETRGQGWGRHFLESLMQMAVTRHQATRFTLNVYRDNLAAQALYRRCGFVLSAQPVMADADAMVLEMSPQTS